MPLSDKTEDRLRRIALWSARFGFGPAARPRRSRRPLPLAAWMLGLGLIAIGLLAYNYWDQQYELILALRDATPVDEVAIAQARNDILRNTLTATAGFAAAAVLLLNFQKQRYEEYNATQQRIADLRIQAVEQLGSESPSVRIGGLHNLERLGESHPELRQVVLDEICSYLRLDQRQSADSDTNPEGEPGPDITQARFPDDEAEVRLIALEILQRHLKFRTRAQRSRYWSHTRINLKNAALQDLDLSDCLINEANFRGAQFRGGTRFGDAQFHGYTRFGGAQFHGYTGFGDVQFHGEASFGGAQFHGGAWFGDARLHGATNFGDAQFHGYADFGGAQFHGGAGFVSAQFRGGTRFGDAQFHMYARFEGAQFHGYADFMDAQFHVGAHFEDAQFHGNAHFGGVQFHGNARFGDAQFHGYADFGDAQFHVGAGFWGAQFHGDARFGDAQFHGATDFEGAQFPESADFARAADSNDDDQPSGVGAEEDSA